jgi:hypothetical protein
MLGTQDNFQTDWPPKACNRQVSLGSKKLQKGGPNIRYMLVGIAADGSPLENEGRLGQSCSRGKGNLVVRYQRTSCATVQIELSRELSSKSAITLAS